MGLYMTQLYKPGGIRVLVAGSGNVTGMNIVRAIKESVELIIGIDCGMENPADKFCKNYTVPLAEHHDYIKTLIDIIRKNHITHIFASNDHDLRSCAEHRDVLSKENIMLNGTGKNILCWLDKKETARLFQLNNIATPELLEKITAPCVIRKNKAGDGKKFVYILKNDYERNSIPCYPVQDAVITRYKEGEEYTIDVLCDNQSNVLSAVPRKRRRVEGGMAHFAEVMQDDALISKVCELSQKLGLTGVNCVQCIKQDSEYYFIEINPRPGSGLDLTIHAGVNMPLLWIFSTMGTIPLHCPPPVWGMKMLRYYDGYYFV
jgi:carbamoyl-phosphate synthase large subunit